MKISPLNNFNYNPSFGYISTKAIDSFRRASENYSTILNSNEENVAEYYKISQNDYPRMNTEQIAALKVLVARASALKKRLIATTNPYGTDACLYTTNEKGECCKVQTQGYTQDSYCKDTHIDRNLKILERVVEKAEELEKEDKPDMKPEDLKKHANHRWYSIDLTKRKQPSFQPIYDLSYGGKECPELK